VTAPQDVRNTLDAAIRIQLSAAYERGKADYAIWDNTGTMPLADTGAPAAINSLSAWLDEYAAALASLHRGRRS
jgi:hypothetical protein